MLGTIILTLISKTKNDLKNICTRFNRSTHIFIINSFCIYSMTKRLQESIHHMNNALADIKGGGNIALGQPTQKAYVEQEADAVLRPLMEVMDGK